MPTVPTLVIAPDSFKSSLSADRVAKALSAGLARERLGLQLLTAPMADGGEGTLDCATAALPGQQRTTRLTGVNARLIKAAWRMLDDRRAVIESAIVLGLPLIDPSASTLSSRGSAALGALMQARWQTTRPSWLSAWAAAPAMTAVWAAC